MTIEQTVVIPASHLLTIEVPREVPEGPVILTFTPASTVVDPKPEEVPNAVTIAAFEEGDAMIRGDIPAKWYNTLDEMLVDLDKDD